ncbi:MAG: hypothetical protein BGO07_02980 [Alphaproteobacteria bacterium 40-19]|nr:MAG: hypothetical protein BGO07_02980 [Alphaproteobacteria bacterium 40-19]
MKKSKGFIFLGILILTGCSSFQVERRKLAYLERTPLSLRVKVVDVCQGLKDFKESVCLLPCSVFQMIKQWAESSFQPNGHVGRLQIQVEEIEVVEKKIEEEDSANPVKSRCPEQYCGKIRITLKIINQGTGQDKTISQITVLEKRPSPSNHTVRQRRILVTQLVEDMIERLDHEVINFLKIEGYLI